MEKIPAYLIGRVKHIHVLIQDPSETVDAVLLTTDDSVLEIVSGSVVRSYTERKVVRGTREIVSYCSLKPFKKLYVVHGPGKAVVLSRGNTLRVLEVYEGYTVLSFRDVLHNGDQMAVFEYEDGTSKATDFSGREYQCEQGDEFVLSSRSSPPSKSILSAAQIQAKNIEKRIKDVKSHIIEKKKLIRRITDEAFTFCKDEEIPANFVPMEHEALYSKFQSMDVDRTLPSSGISVKSPWFKYFEGSWVVGVPITNNLKSPLEDVDLYLSQENIKNYSTAFLHRDSTGDFYSHHNVPEGSSGNLVCVFQEPFYEEMATAFRGIVTYKRENNENTRYIVTDAIHVHISHINDSSEFYNRDFDENNLVAALSVYKRAEILLNVYDLEDFIYTLNCFGFKTYGDHMIFNGDPSYPSYSCLRGLILRISQEIKKSTHKLTIHYRDHHHLRLFLKVLKAELFVRAKVKPTLLSDSRDFVEQILSEISTMISSIGDSVPADQLRGENEALLTFHSSDKRDLTLEMKMKTDEIKRLLS